MCDELLGGLAGSGEGGFQVDAVTGGKASPVGRRFPPSPAVCVQIDPHFNNRDSLPPKSACLFVRGMSGERDGTVTVEDPVPGNLDSRRKGVERVADRPCPSGYPRSPGDITVCCDAPCRNPFDHAPDTSVCICRGPFHWERPLPLGPVARYRKQLTVWSFTTPTA